MTNSASGEADWTKRPSPDEGAGEVSGGDGQSNRSGSVRQISCHSGWKLSQPASGNPVCLAVYVGQLVGDRLRRAGGHRQQLGLAAAVHAEEPEHGLVDGLADGEQPVVLVDRRLAGAERGGDLLAGLDLEHHGAALLGDHRVVVVEDARVLGDRVERDAERAERLAVRRCGCAPRR